MATLRPTGPADLVPVGRSSTLGTVIEFDDERGVGTIRCDPERLVPFHCTAISDGSRSIAVGTVVTMHIRAARLGLLEADSVWPLPDSSVGEHHHESASTMDPASDGTVLVDEAEPPPAVSIDIPLGPEPEMETVAIVPPPATPPPAPPGSRPTGRIYRPPVPSTSEPVHSSDSTSSNSTSSDSTSSPPATGSAPLPGAEDETPPSGTSPVKPEDATYPPEDEGEDSDALTPHPNFWSPFSSSPTGPPPTWSTPKTPRVDP